MSGLDPVRVFADIHGLVQRGSDPSDALTVCLWTYPRGTTAARVVELANQGAAMVAAAWAGVR